MELDTGLTLISVICTCATVYFTFTSQKYFSTVQEYFQVVKKNEINDLLKIAVAEMKKFGAGCTEESLIGLSPRLHTRACSRVQDLIATLRRNQRALNTKALNLATTINDLDSLLLTFSRVKVTETASLMANGKPLYDKLNDLESHFDPTSSLPPP